MSAKNVFIIGSGFSASMGLPTLNNLFQEIMSGKEREGLNDKEDTLNALSFLYPHFSRNNSNNSYPPFEEFLSLITAAEEFSLNEPDSAFEPGYWQDKKKGALRLLTDYISNKSEKAKDSTLLLSFVERLSPGDVVITFNWDNLIEVTA